MKLRILAATAAIALSPALALAQGATQRGAVDGTVTGGQIGGPVGAAVGGTVGAAVGAAIDIPTAVISSITGAPGPSVVYEEPIVVGEPLPPRVEMRVVPEHTEYRYAYVNNKRYIVEPRTRRVLRVID